MILMKALVDRPTARLTSTCPTTEVKAHSASLEVKCSQHFEFPAVVSFLHYDYCNKWAYNQILLDVGLEKIHIAGDRAPGTAAFEAVISPM